MSTTKEDGIANVRCAGRMIRASRLLRWRSRGLSAADWRLLAVVAVAQIVTAVALRAVPLAAVRGGASRFRRLAHFLAQGSDDRIVWAIEATGKRLGRLSTCLIRALVAALMVDTNDGPVSLTIGVRRTAAGTLDAHAWLARQDRVLIGATLDEYVTIATWVGGST